MTYSKLGIDGTLSEQPDPRTGKAIPVFIPTLDPTGKEIPVYLYKSSRPLGTYIIGLQGMGKSGLLEELILADIKQEIGVCVLDPHGELVDNIIARLPDGQKEEKVIHLDLAETNYFFGLNLFACPDPTSDDEITKVVNQVVHVFEKAFGISMEATPRIYDYLFYSAYTLIANPGYTLIDIPLVFDAACRSTLLANVHSSDVHKFWAAVKQLPPTDQSREERELLRRLNDLSHAPLRYIVGQSLSTIDLRRIMDEGKILLVKLDRQREQATSLIGSILVAHILNAANARQTNKLFNLYADEFQNFATEDFTILLEQARKRGIGVTMAHQNRSQLELSDRQADKNLKARTLNVGNLVVFRVPTDAEGLAGQFNITPQPAWEQEIEPEQIKVLRPQQHERKVEVVDDGVEEIKTPVANPVEFLLTSSGHPDPAVIYFVTTYLRLLERLAKTDLSQFTLNGPHSQFYRNLMTVGVLDSPFSAGSLNNTQVFFRFLKDFLADVMRTRNPLLAIPKEVFPGIGWWNGYDGTWYIFGFAEIARFYGAGYRYRGQANIETFRRVFSTLLTSPYGTIQATPQEKAAAISDMQEEIIFQLIDANIKWNPTPEDNDDVRYLNAKKAYEEELRNPQSQKAQLLISCLAYEITQAERFFMALRAFLQGIVAQPILGPSGQYQPRRRTQVTYISHESEKITIPRKTILHPQRSYADVQAERAAELVNFPQYTARVKLSDGSGHTVEHIIRTIAPGRGLSGTALQERIERIKARNRGLSTFLCK